MGDRWTMEGGAVLEQMGGCLRRRWPPYAGGRVGKVAEMLR